MTKHPYLIRRHHHPAAAYLALAGLIAAAVLLLTSSTDAAGTPSNPGVCQPQDQHQTPSSTTAQVTVTAPAGQLISGYCVKAGSAQQGNGPEYVTIDPPATQVTITHSSGKDISHYVVSYVPATTTSEGPTTTVPDSTTTTIPETTTTVPDGSATTGPPVLIPPVSLERPEAVVADPSFAG